MFRYIGLAWDNAQPMASARARQLAMGLQARAGWNAALVRPGLQVFAAGARPGINSAYPLQGDQGVALGKLFRRCDLGSLPASDVSLTPLEAERILESGGRALVRDFWGRYIAFIQTAPGATCVLRDPSGTLPCFLIRHHGVSIVFSWLEDVLEMLAHVEPPRVNWDALEAHILLGALGGRETALEGVSQILPGEVLDLSSGGSTLLWSAVDIAQSPTAHSAAQAAALLRETVRACARSWASCYDTILFRLSGGVDSSILLSCLAPDGTQADVICVNYHSPGSDSDERRYARLAAGRAGRDLIERERDSDFRIDRVLKIARMPGPVPYIGWMNARTDAKLASAHSAAALFSGAGGDPLFFEFARWWPAADYLRSRGLDAGFAAAAMDAARLGRVSVWRAAAMAVAERVRPNSPAREPSGHAAALLGQGLLNKEMQRERFVHPDLLRATLPIGKHTQTVQLMYPIGYYDPFEQASAPELVNPLLSQPLVELCLGLPTYVLTQGGRGRALARRAFAPDLPPPIATRRSKGGMEEHIEKVLLSNLAFARGMLIEGELVRRGLLDRTKVEELLSGKPTALAGPLSQIHALIGVEAWLARWPR
jgi:asparagine synthase (glutamine-hydrolysing)